MVAKIEELRAKLEKKVKIADRDFLSKSVLHISERLDRLIIKEMKSLKN